MATSMETGAAAAAHLQPYNPAISNNFEIPMHIGRLIAQWDKPEYVSAAKAHHMREEDYVVGLVHQGEAVAFPLWITDYYHVVNCRIAGDPVMFTTCERCQSGAAFLSEVDGEPVKFSATGMYNASLTLTERQSVVDRQGSLWLHYEGICIDGRHKGKFLTQISTYHMTWSEWKHLHPETSVMTEPEDCHHQDARHGHGREEYFSRPGMDPPLIQTITGDLDGRYPENEMVLGINTDQILKAWPLREVQKSGGVVHERIGDAPLAIFAGPSPDQVTMAAYSCIVNGKSLSFTRADNHFVDTETNSIWTIEGQAIDGPLTGHRLTAIRWQYVRWHAWFYPHRDTDLFLHRGNPALLDTESFQPILDRLRQTGREVVVEQAVPHLCLPHETSQGLVVRVGSDRLNIYQFDTPVAAQDYVDLQGAWFCHPIGVKVGRKFSRRLGHFVLESDPEVQYEGSSQFIRLPDPEIAWSDLVVDDSEFNQLNTEEFDSALPAEPGFVGLITHLKKYGFDVIEAAFLPHSQLRVGTSSAIAATINADRFAIYKCSNVEAAEKVVQEFPHALQIGRWVIRSTPAIMFQDPCYEMGQLPEEEARWSRLLDKERLSKTLKMYLLSKSPDQLKVA